MIGVLWIALWVIVWGLVGIAVHALALSRQESHPDQMKNYIEISIYFGWAITALLVLGGALWVVDGVARRLVLPPLLWLSGRFQQAFKAERVQRLLDRWIPAPPSPPT